MKLVAHISDPHFGSEDPAIAAELLRELRTLDPAVVAISGDLTQRGRRVQFRAAKSWLEHLGMPYVVVPGNHDIPMFDLFTRVVRPRDRYLDTITRDLEPSFFDDSIAVCGIDTTKVLTTKHGRVPHASFDRVLTKLEMHDRHWRILVAHHPFVVPPGSGEPTVRGAEDALAELEDAGVDIILTGHLHLPHSEGSAGRNPRHTVINVHAGTCMSTRTRGEPNGYNQLRFTDGAVTIVHREWNGLRFVDGAEKTYRRGWAGGDRIVKVAELPPSPRVAAH